jgi:iron complex outermembrane receptor protein
MMSLRLSLRRKFHFMKNRLLFSLGILSTIVSAQAQENHSTGLDSVVVTENRFTSYYREQNKDITILDSKQIKALPVKTVTEVLSYAAGVDFRQRGPWSSQADVSIDGSTFDQVLVLVNGMKMSDPQTGHHILNLPIPISAIDHIEVLRGPAAKVYGVNALAGAINIITKKPVQNEVAAQVYSGSNFQKDTATGNTYVGYGAQASASLVGKAQSHIISASQDQGNGYRHNTAFNASRLFYQNHFDINAKNSIEATGGYIYNKFGANGFYSAPKDAESQETVQTALASIMYIYRPNENVSIRPRISYRYNNDDYIFVRQNPSLYHNIHETNVLTGEIQSTIQVKNGTIGTGTEIRNEQINSTNLGERSRTNIGLYGEYKHNFSCRLNAGAGLYANYNSDYDIQVFPGIDAGYRLNNEWKVFANATMGQRLPTYTDLYYKGPLNIGNDKLRPEYAKYAEGGLQYSKRIISLQATYFYRNVTDFIDWVRTNNTAPWQPRNFQSINTTGITARAIYQLSDHIGLSDDYKLNLNVNYTYLDPVVTSPSSDITKYAIEALRHQFIASLQSTFFNRLQLNAACRYQYRINTNDYTVVDLRIAWNMKKWGIFADVNNLLGTQYKEIGSVPLPGRWISLGLRGNMNW